MNPNILLYRPPEHVQIRGQSVPIHSAHRIWIKMQKCLDDPSISDEQAFALIITSAYGKDFYKSLTRDDESKDAVDAALRWFNFNEPTRPPTPSQKKKSHIRAWDWDWDGRYAIADFQRYYGIDLTDPNMKMHWWRFWALFTGLPEESESMSLIALRTADEDGLSADQKRAQRERQLAHMLPARSEEEVLRNNKLRWGQDV